MLDASTSNLLGPGAEAAPLAAVLDLRFRPRFQLFSVRVPTPAAPGSAGRGEALG